MNGPPSQDHTFARAVLVRFGLPLAAAIPLMVFADRLTLSPDDLEHRVCHLSGFSSTCEYVEHPPTYGPPVAFTNTGVRP